MIKHKTKFLFGLLAVMYPIFVFCTLVVFKLPIRYLSVGIIVFGVAYSLLSLKQGKGNHKIALFVSPVILITIGIISLFLDDNPIVIKMYPAMADLSYLTIMVTSIIVQPPLVYHFINTIDKSIKDTVPKEIFTSYCIIASIIWCVFFIVDAIIATIIAFFGTTMMWAIYCGGITYGCMALIFIGEFVIIKRIKKKFIKNKEMQKNVNS